MFVQHCMFDLFSALPFVFSIRLGGCMAFDVHAVMCVDCVPARVRGWGSANRKQPPPVSKERSRTDLTASESDGAKAKAKANADESKTRRDASGLEHKRSRRREKREYDTEQSVALVVKGDVPSAKVSSRERKALSLSLRLSSESAGDATQVLDASAANKFVSQLRTALSTAANSCAATWMSAYLRDQFSFFGVKQPERAKLQVHPFASLAASAEPHPLTWSRLSATILLAWDQKEREFQLSALDLARQHVELHTAASLDTFEKLIRDKPWWDTVDLIATQLVGPLIMRFPLQLLPRMDQWVNDECLWIRRVALLYQLKYKKHTDVERLFRYCSQLAPETEFFIQKAIGWVLREYAKTDKQAVVRYLTEHENSLSKLSCREARRYLR